MSEPKFESLVVALETISNEAQIVGNLFNYFNRKSANLAIGITDGFKCLTTYNYSPLLELNPARTEQFLVNGIEYLDQKDLVVGIPFGLKVEMVDYSTNLMANVSKMNFVMDHIVANCKITLGHFLSTPSLRSERRFEKTYVTPVCLDGLKRTEGLNFDGTRKAQGTFHDYYNSFADFIQTERNLENAKGQIKHSLADVRKSVDDLSQINEALFKQLAIKPNNPLEQPSKEFTLHISEMLLYTAKWIEWYALQTTRLIETNNVVAETEKVLRKL